jgi:hypothetical protein
MNIGGPNPRRRWFNGVVIASGIALIVVGCGASEERSDNVIDSFEVADTDGTDLTITVVQRQGQECVVLDDERGEWCGAPIGSVDDVRVVGTASAGVGNQFEWTVVGLAPLAVEEVRVSVGDSSVVTPTHAGRAYSVWMTSLSQTVPGDQPLESPPNPSVSASAVG